MIEYFLYLSPIFHRQNILPKTGDQELAKLRVRLLVGSPAFSLPMVYYALSCAGSEYYQTSQNFQYLMYYICMWF